MDWKREAVDKLRCYEAKKGSISRANEELRRLEDELTGIRSASTDSIPVSGSTCRREDAIVNNIAHQEELKLAKREAIRWVRIVDGGLSALDEDERKILDRMYIHRCKGNVDRLCEELGLDDTSSVYRRKDKALRHFTLALYGVTET